MSAQHDTIGRHDKCLRFAACKSNFISPAETHFYNLYPLNLIYRFWLFFSLYLLLKLAMP